MNIFPNPNHTFTYLADTFSQSDLQCIQVIHFLSECVFPGNRTTFVLLTQCSTTEPQEHSHNTLLTINKQQISSLFRQT